MTEMDHIEFNDLCADLTSAIERWGARFVYQEFSQRYPTHAQELVAQINRTLTKPVPALFKKLPTD